MDIGKRKFSMKASKNRKSLNFNAPIEESDDDQRFNRYLQPEILDDPGTIDF